MTGNIGSRFSYRADFVRREFHDFYNLVINTSTGFVTTPTGNELDFGLIGNTNSVERNYTGLQTQFQYRWNWLTVGGNWQWSHTLGNFDAEAGNAGAVTNATEAVPGVQAGELERPVRVHGLGPAAPRSASSRRPTFRSSRRRSATSTSASSRATTRAPRTAPWARSARPRTSRTRGTSSGPRRPRTTTRRATRSGRTTSSARTSRSRGRSGSSTPSSSSSSRRS